MRVAVTGANGHVGANVVRDLLAHGFAVRALCLHGSERSALAGLDVEVAEIDILHPESLDAAFRAVDAVIHLAAKISIQGDRDGSVMCTNMEGARNVARACLARDVAKLVHVSSLHAFKFSPADHEVNETAPAADHTCFAYDRSKAAGEDEILAAVREEGLDATILNPTGILGPHDYVNSRGGGMLRSFYRGQFSALIDAGFDWVDVRDVAGAIRQTMHGGRAGERYLISGRWASIKELADLCEDVTGTRRRRVVLPWWTALLGLPAAQLQSLMAKEPPLFTYESLMILRGSNKNCSSDKARREIDYAPRPLDETVRDTYEWSRAHGHV